MTFLLCDPGWYVQRTLCPEWMGRKHTQHTPSRMTFARNLRIVPRFTKLDSNTADPWLLRTFSSKSNRVEYIRMYVWSHIKNVKFVWVYQPESHRRRSYKISHPPSFYDACLISREEDSSVPFPRRNLCTFPVMFRRLHITWPISPI